MLNQIDYLTSANDPTGFAPDRGREVAFAGRSNAGKSSAINAICSRRNLARTSRTPGRTQLVNFFALPDGNRLVDLPGYGFAKVPERIRAHWRHLMQAYFDTRRSLAGLVVVVDIRRPLTDFDRQMVDWALAVGCPVHMLLTKADKLSRGAAAASLQKVRRHLEGRAGAQVFSAKSGAGVDAAREAVTRFLAGGD